MGVLLKICGLVIDFDTRYPDYIKTRCERYLAAAADLKSTIGSDILHISVSQEDIDRSDINHAGQKEAELYAMTMHLGEVLPGLGRLMTHGVAVSCDGVSYIFTAPSGTGKSTHAFLWQKYLGTDRVQIINGDKPILWFTPDGQIMACGSPWNGKEGLDKNVCLPLRGICLLKRLENSPEAMGPEIKKAGPGQAFDFLLNQTFLPHNPAGQMQTLQLLEKLCNTVPVYNLTADISRESVLVSTRCLLGDVGLRQPWTLQNGPDE